MTLDGKSPDITLKQLYEEIINSKEEVKSSISATETRLTQELKLLKNRIDQLEKENSDLKEKLEYVDRENRKNNIIIFGLNKSVKETTPQLICEELHRVLNVELKESDIDNCYKLGKTEDSPIKVELISNLKKKVIFSKVKQLKDTPLSISNDLTGKQREELKILRANLLKARTNSTRKSYIRGNRLVVGTREYTLKELINNEQKAEPHGPSLSAQPINTSGHMLNHPQPVSKKDSNLGPIGPRLRPREGIGKQ